MIRHRHALSFGLPNRKSVCIA